MRSFTKILPLFRKLINTKKRKPIIILLALFAVNAPMFTTNAFAQQKPQDKMVKIKGHTLHMMSIGKGEFTVIFESGFGNDLSHWRKVAPAISQKAKVVVYSRAGYGRSEPVAKPLTLTESTEELTQLIHQAHLKPPFILVGHSYGGHIVRTYAAQNPQSIAGLVFVDPANEQFIKKLKQLDEAKTNSFLEVYKKMVPEKLKAESEILMAIDEKGALPDFGPLPDVPAAILTSMVQEYPQFIIHSKEGKKIWRELHTRLFNQFSSARHIVTMNSGHNIAIQEPELVVEAINSAIEQAAKISQQKRLVSSMKNAIELINLRKIKEAEIQVFDGLKNAHLRAAQINSLGYQYLNNKNATQKDLVLATMILKYNMMNNQQSANAFDSYGESLLAVNNPQKAKVQFLQAIKLMEAIDKSHSSIKGFKANLRKTELAMKSAQ